MCIELGADPNELSYDGQLELNTAITNGWNDYLLLLLEKKADPNAIDKNGDSPMHVAAQKGDEQTMQVLRKHGAKSFPNNSGQTPEDILSHKLSVTATIQLGLFQSKEIGGSLLTLDSASSSPQQL
jgi:ankyrin repeat protein